MTKCLTTLDGMGETSDYISDGRGDCMCDYMSDGMGDYMSDDVSDGTKDYMSDRISDDMSNAGDGVSDRIRADAARARARRDQPTHAGHERLGRG